MSRSGVIYFLHVCHAFTKLQIGLQGRYPEQSIWNIQGSAGLDLVGFWVVQGFSLKGDCDRVFIGFTYITYVLTWGISRGTGEVMYHIWV